VTGRSAARAAMGNRDANHADVQRWYEELWCLVHDTHALGGGFPDMMVGISTPMRQIPALVEVKTADGRLKPSQETFLRLWGTGCVEVVRSRRAKDRSHRCYQPSAWPGTRHARSARHDGES
jgi:hypothetical protein